MGSLVTLDWLAIAAYFIAVIGLAFWAVRRETTTRETSAGYFLAGPNVGWFGIGASLFASNIGPEHLIGLTFQTAGAGSAAAAERVISDPTSRSVQIPTQHLAGHGRRHGVVVFQWIARWSQPR